MNGRYYLLILVLSVISTAFITTFQVASAQQQQQKSYYIYVDPVPDFAQPYATNVIDDTITSWHNANPNINFYRTTSYQQSDFRVQWIKETGTYWSGEALLADHIMQVTLGDSNCNGQWQPYSPSTLNRIAEHELGHLLGLQHTTVHNDVMNPDESYFQLGIVTQNVEISANHHHFVLACGRLDSNSYSYSVSSSNQNLAFNVYFVPSIQEMYNYENSVKFLRYTTCSQVTQNGWITYSNNCNGVPSGSGLLIIMNNEAVASNSLTNLNVQSLVQLLL